MKGGNAMARIRLRKPAGIVELKYTVVDIDRHGNARVYARRNGRKIRLRRLDDAEAFVQEYRAALSKLESGEPAAQPFASASPGSFRWLCERYYGSAEYKMLAPGTQYVRRLILDNFNRQHGHKPYAKMEPKHVRAWRDAKAEKPEAANSVVKALRQVYRWAMLAGHCDFNPPAQVPYIKTKSDGWHTWTIDEVKQYLAYHGRFSPAGRALYFLLYTGMAENVGAKMDHLIGRIVWSGRSKIPPLVTVLVSGELIRKAGGDVPSGSIPEGSACLPS